MTTAGERRTFWVGALLVAVFLSLPLFVGLNEPQMQSDEAIYSYAVERILDTGHWLTPRSIPGDGPFLEKPPLKFWIVAGGIKSGWLPRNDAGLRWFDALFGAIAFFYVFLIGCRLAGPTCGVVSVFVLFTMSTLVFDHGLRSNNMEAPLFLSYCGGLYHFLRWADRAPSSSRLHAWAAAGWFVLGFMTKFVAVVFLPIVCLASLAWRPRGASSVRGGWREWLLPIGGVIAVTAPWFVYESRLFGSEFWQIIFGVHVFKRFTTGLDPAHLHPWHYYVSGTWEELGHSGSQILVALGIVRLAIVAWRGESWTARVVLIWAVLPIALISIGSSKLMHYAFPFWPPLGLAAGLFASWALDHAAQHGPLILERIGLRVRPVLVAAAALMFAIACWTILIGPVKIDVGSLTLYRNSSFLRPAFAAAALFWLATQATVRSRLLVATVLLFLLPLARYMDNIHQLGRVDHPIRAARECIDAVQASGAPVGRGVMYASGEEVIHHGYYFYLWRTGPWVVLPQFSPDETRARLTRPGEQTPVILVRHDYNALFDGATDESLRQVLTARAVAFDDLFAMILPGPFGVCAKPILEAEGREIWNR